MKDKVSVLVPCYNTAKYLEKFILSIINQNYSPLQLIMVNDGSTDDTEQIILSFKDKFEQVGIQFVYLKKENGGASSAVALGLKYVDGEYLIWPDSDDWLLEDSIKIRVKYMNEHPEVAFLRCNGFNYDENYKLLGKITKDKKNKFFEDFLMFNVPWSPGCYMVRYSAFKDANPDGYIYICNIGQNIQMMLPIAFKYKCHYLDKDVYGYLVRTNSHSRTKNITYEKRMARLDGYKDCVYNTLEYIGADEKYKKMFDSFILRQKYEAAWKFKNKSQLIMYRSKLKGLKEYGLKCSIMFNFPYNKLTDFMITVFNKFGFKN